MKIQIKTILQTFSISIFCMVFLCASSASAQLSAGIKLLNNPKSAERELKPEELPCSTLEERVITQLKKIIKQGIMPIKSDSKLQSINTNISAMNLNKCDKDALYGYINQHLTFDDPLYFQLNAIL